MRLTIVDQNINIEHEYDHETAVELSHDIVRETELKLRTEGGLIITARETYITSTTSYLEPIFEGEEEDDVFEANKRNSDPKPLEYQRIPSENPAKEWSSYHIDYQRVFNLPLISEKDLEVLEDRSNDIYNPDTSVPREISEKLMDYETYHANFDKVSQETLLDEQLNVVPTMAQAIFAIFNDASKPHQGFIEIEFNRRDLATIEALEKKNEEQRKINTHNRMMNSIEEDSFKAKQDIGTDVIQKKYDLGLFRNKH